MKNRFYDNHELKDNFVIAALKQSIEDYKSGAIIECKDTLANIVEAISEFEKDYSLSSF